MVAIGQKRRHAGIQHPFQMGNIADREDSETTGTRALSFGLFPTK